MPYYLLLCKLCRFFYFLNLSWDFLLHYLIDVARVYTKAYDLIASLDVAGFYYWVWSHSWLPVRFFDSVASC